jgi:hypothetical protein
MPASIRTTLTSSPGGPVVGPVLVDQSRDDLRKGYQVILESVNVHTTYAWAISFKPEAPDRTDSAAALLPPEGSTSSTAKFNIDYEGAYLIRLVVDAGLPTEDTMYLRLRSVTRFGNLKLVAAGERRDQNGVIPVDATAEGWSNDQNQNMQLLLAQLRRQATTGRILWVDANRGRDSANNQNDPAVTYELPGSDPADTADDVSFTAERHGDFSTINEAITYANAAAGRGEAAPSLSDPYFIRIKPGLYVEDLSLQPHIHLMGEDWVTEPVQLNGEMPVIVRTANAGGLTHSYTPAGDTDPVYLARIGFENADVTTKPVIEHTRGYLLLDHCTVFQRANSATQGACIETITAGGGQTAYLGIFDSHIVSLANTNDDNWAIIVDAEPGSRDPLTLVRTQVEGRSAVSFNESNYQDAGASFIESTVVGDAGYGLRSGGGIDADRSIFESADASKCVLVDGFLAGAGANPGNVTVTMTYCTVNRVIFDKTFVGGLAQFRGGAITTGSTPDQWLQAPGGALDETSATATARSIEYHIDWRLPENQPAGAETVPTNSEFPYRNVQDVLDLLANIVNPQGAAIGGAWPNTGGLTLDAAYDGVASYSPFLAGSGIGKYITADQGAVGILGATSPGGGVIDPTLAGGLQVELGVDIGPFVADGLGSEMWLEANPFGYGPRATFGRSVWNNELTANPLPNPRPAPAGFIRGGLNAADGGYSLWLLTRSTQDSGQGEQGRIVISAGRTNDGGTGNTDGGNLFLAAGDVQDAGGAGLGGHIWLTPGWTANAGDDGRLRIVHPTTATQMVILASVTYLTNGPLSNNGTLHLATPDEHFQIALTAGMTLAQVVTAINTACAGEIVAADNAGKLQITAAKRGVNSEVFVVGVSNLGGGTSVQFFNELGEIQESVAPGVTTQGDYPDYVELECTTSGELTVHGTIIASFQKTYYNWVVGAPASPLAHGGEGIVGVDTTAGPGTVDLPALGGVGDAGKEFTIKYEAGGNPVTVNGNVANIDGAATVVLNVLYQSVTVYWGGAQWFIK